MFCPEINPSHSVPALVVINVNTSLLFRVEVKDGATPEGHTTDPGHDTALAVPSAVNTNVNDVAWFAVLGTLVMFMVVTAAFKEVKNTVAVLQSRVRVPDEITGAAVDSVCVFISSQPPTVAFADVLVATKTPVVPTNVVMVTVPKDVTFPNFVFPLLR